METVMHRTTAKKAASKKAGEGPTQNRPLPAERVFSLVATLLESPRAMTREEILDRLKELYVPHGTPAPDPETLRKMFERDKRLIKDMGLPLVTAPVGESCPGDPDDGALGYRIEESDLHVPEIQLDEGQRMLLLAVVQTLLSTPGFPLREDLCMAAHKVLLASGEGKPLLGKGPVSHMMMDVQGWSLGERELTLVKTALLAVHERRRLVLSYRAAGHDQVTDRVVDPYGITLVDGSWLITGMCHLRGQVRTFSLGRVLDMAIEDPDCAGAQFEVPAHFCAKDVVREPPWLYRVHDPLTVVIEVDEDFEWHAAALIGCEKREKKAGAVRFEVQATNADALVELAIAHGPRLRILSPSQVSSRVVEEIRRLGAGVVPGVLAAAAPRRRTRARSSAPSRRARRDDAMGRLRRFAFLVSYLSTHHEVDLAHLGTMLGVSEAVLASDLERLSVCGVYPSTDFRLFDVSVDQEASLVRFRRNPVSSLARPVRLDRREVVALLLAFKALRDGIAPPFDWAADHVMREVIRTAGHEAETAVRELESRVSMGSRHDMSFDIFYELSRAVGEKRRVRMDYYTQGRDSQQERTVHPYVLVCSLGRWYLIAHCELRGEVRTFRLDRIRSARIVDGRFEAPAGFDPRTHMASGIFPPGPGQDGERVVVAFDPAFVRQHRDLGRRATRGPDGESHVSFGVPADRFESFVSWLVSMGTSFRIVGPDALISCLEARRSRLLSAYSTANWPSGSDGYNGPT